MAPGKAPDEAALAALAQAWLPTDDPAARTRIAGFLGGVGAAGLDPGAALRDALRRWFGARRAGVALPGADDAEPRPAQEDADARGMALRPLAGLRAPTLWPQRPKRRPDELFSSWLRRSAVAAGVPPRVFAQEALGAAHLDADRFVPAPVLHRLALASGHAVDDLVAGTLLPPPPGRAPAAATAGGLVEDAALAHGGLLLGGAGGRARGRAHLQFCPLCLAESPCPAFRRGWRFAHEVACLRHRVRLHAGCPGCGAIVEPLRQASTAAQPDCPRCGRALADAPAVRRAVVAARQRAMVAWLGVLSARGERDALGAALDRLGDALRAAGPGVEARERACAALPFPPAVWRRSGRNRGRGRARRRRRRVSLGARSSPLGGP